ncbi:PhzF family phenazine biosynthesis protein [Chromobacterium sp. IIBBL 290-4]|uniref:PhzF family phenazine biosynthesis protein n=1 Tax=Chromobacterium sp. IIBBL 290-4 TaxID=2953890 RepID=UPI0020B8C382|nr:PhzF family phenazine biosynthesis protein [Chromobacterium sp. IIBBL 290-4]UTH73560.1 PhzF family phenazine biosynthesis protein [Chromobacterium sp. IIBBL 290-4]
MDMKAYRCFGRETDSGNLALVFSGDGVEALGQAERLALAQQHHAPASVFVAPSPDGVFTLDYYYPHARSVLCLHASLAAAAFLRGQFGAIPMALRTASGQDLSLSQDGEAILFRLQRQAMAASAPSVDEVAAWLGCEASGILSMPVVASVGSPKLLVALKDQTVLAQLRPNLQGIVEWGKRAGVNGCYAYAALAEGVYTGRNFNHLDPGLEDAATGVAAGALCAQLERDLTLRQGDGQGNPCELRAKFGGGWVEVGGMARAAAMEAAP